MRKIYEDMKRSPQSSLLPTRRKAIQKIIDSPWQVLVDTKENVMFFSDHQCDIVIPYISHTPRFISYGFPKNSPYRDLFQYNVLKLQETGALALIKARNHHSPKCLDTREVSLGLRKLVSMFGIVALGSGLALAVFFLEKATILAKGPEGRFNSGVNYRGPPPIRIESYSDIASPKSFGSIHEDRLRTLARRWGIADAPGFARDVSELIGLDLVN